MDIGVLSCGHWGPGHFSAWTHIDKSCKKDLKLKEAWKETQERLKDVVGDLGWWPVTPTGIWKEETEDLPVWAATRLTRQRLFEPGVSGKPGGQSLGLGLAICRELARAAGGEISVSSPLTGSTLFRVALPPAGA